MACPSPFYSSSFPLLMSPEGLAAWIGEPGAEGRRPGSSPLCSGPSDSLQICPGLLDINVLLLSFVIVYCPRPQLRFLYILNTFCIFMPFMVPISAQRGHEPEFVHSRHFAIVVHQPLRISCAHLAVTTPMMRGLNQHAAQLSSSAIFVHQKNRAPSSFPFLPILLSRVSTDPGRRSTLRIFFTFREFQLILVENTHRAHFREPQLILIGGEHRAFWPAQKPHFHAQPSQHLNKSKYAPWPTTPHGDLQHGGFA
ncbi:hypothetical protein N7536_004052 [Penicillium majusculum]|nr:hypothetical protein N7536_004052 [Penicillium majusculum]